MLPTHIKEAIMTDRIKGLTVVLDHNIRDDDSEAIVHAILMIRGVVAVSRHVADPDHYMAVTKAKSEIEKKFHDILYAPDSH